MMVQLTFAWIVLFELDETGCKFLEKSSLQMFLDPSGGCFGKVRSSFWLFILFQFVTSWLAKDVLDLL